MRRFFVIIGFLLCTIFVEAQNTDFGGIITGEISQDISKLWSVSFSEELRFNKNFSQYDRSQTALGVDYTFFRGRMKAGGTAEYHNKFTDNHIYRNRWRFSAHLSYIYKYRYYTFNLRTRLQSTYYDSHRGDFRINPKIYWRNRLEISYKRLNSRLKYSLSGEFFWLVNAPKHNVIDDVRLTASAEYRLTRRSYLDIFCRDDKEIQVVDPQRMIYFGVGYKFKE